MTLTIITDNGDLNSAENVRDGAASRGGAPARNAGSASQELLAGLRKGDGLDIPVIQSK